MDWTPDLRLEGDGILLRPYLDRDTDELFAAATESTREVFPWLPWCHAGYERRQAREWARDAADRWRSDESFDFVILAKRDKHFLGACSLNRWQKMNRLANLGYWVRTSAAGAGVATAAVPLVADFGFRALALQRVELVIASGNAASHRVAEKVGARREGVLRNRLVLHGTAVDAAMFSLIPSDLDR